MMHDLECLNVSQALRLASPPSTTSRFGIPRGSFFSILGPSGCGKTTLMRMIAGFEEPAAGDIRIKGKSVLGTPPNRRNVKMVFQHLALFPMMNVGENIAYGLRCRGAAQGGDRAARSATCWTRIGLPGVAGKEIDQLSGGQKQRIAIARCMVLEPDVLLLDEPLGALDLKLRERMKIELKLLQHQFDTTFVYITHDQSEALVMSDHVAVMNAGRFEQVGTPQELYHAPGDRLRRRLRRRQQPLARAASSSADGGGVAGRRSAAGPSVGAPAAARGRWRAATAVEVFVRPESIAIARRRTRLRRRRTAWRDGRQPALQRRQQPRAGADGGGELIEVDAPATGRRAPTQAGRGGRRSAGRRHDARAFARGLTPMARRTRGGCR